MEYNFESIKLTNENEKIVRKTKENKKFKNRIKRAVKKVINK